MTRLLRYEPAPSKRVYVAPKGTDPTAYARDLGAQAESFIRENDLHAAHRLLQKRLAVISHYCGSRTIQAAHAMGSLARLNDRMGNSRDGQTWAHYALRAYAALMMDVEARNKPSIMDCMTSLHEAFPDAALPDVAQRGGAPDFTTGTLIRTT